MAKILIVDDELHLRRVLRIFLADQGHEAFDVATGEAALELAEREQFDVILLDLNLPGASGLDILRKLHDTDPGRVIILITAYGSIRSAVDAMRAGAFDYITKPFDNDELLLTIERALSVRRLKAEVQALRTELESRYGFTDLVGTSSAMREVFRVMKKVSQNDVVVLVLGESGTGKELVARGIHRNSGRVTGPFVAVNCSAIPSTLVEAEFFGHERGAFTDAKDARPGKFEQASKGTLFLDEVGDLPLEAQAKLLRVLDERQVTRLGGHRPIHVDARVVAATNRNLEQAVSRGEFREDLYWRLNVVSLHLPPLRERGEDLALLIDHLVERLSVELHREPPQIASSAKELLLGYAWPGNVRELENALRQALVLADGAAIRVHDLPLRVRGRLDENSPQSDELRVGETSLADAVDRATERVERALIAETLFEKAGSRTAAANALGINRKTLFNKMRRYGLARPSDNDEDEQA